jgi:hypothetical protein
VDFCGINIYSPEFLGIPLYFGMRSSAEYNGIPCEKLYAGEGQKELERENIISRTGQPGQDRITRTRQPGQNRTTRTSKAG